VFYYRSFQEQLSTPEVGAYTTFGIAAFRSSDRKQDRLFSISDVSLDKHRVEELAALCTRLQLHPTHLQDVVEDALCG